MQSSHALSGSSTPTRQGCGGPHPFPFHAGAALFHTPFAPHSAGDGTAAVVDQTASTASSRDLSDTPDLFAHPPHVFVSPHGTPRLHTSSGISRAGPIAVDDFRSSTNLFVRRLPPEVTEEELKATFSAYGTITNFVLMRNIHTGRSLRKAFVRFATPDEARAAMTALHETKIRGEPIFIQWANRQHDTTPAGEERSRIRKVFIRNIPVTVTREEIEALCRQFGEVSTVSVHPDTVEAHTLGQVASTRHHEGALERRNIAFVLFEHDGDAQRAVAVLHNAHPFPLLDDGVPLMVKLSEAKKQRMERRKLAPTAQSSAGMALEDFLTTGAPASALRHPSTFTPSGAGYRIGGVSPPVASSHHSQPLSSMLPSGHYYVSSGTPSTHSAFILTQQVASDPPPNERSQHRANGPLFYPGFPVDDPMNPALLYISPPMSRAVSTAYSTPGSPLPSVYANAAATVQAQAEAAVGVTGQPTIVVPPGFECVCFDSATGQMTTLSPPSGATSTFAYPTVQQGSPISNASPPQQGRERSTYFSSVPPVLHPVEPDSSALNRLARTQSKSPVSAAEWGGAAEGVAASFADMERRRAEVERDVELLVDPVSDDETWVEKFSEQLAALVD